MIRSIKQFLLHNTSTRQTAAKNLVWLSISQVGSRVIRAAVIIYAARVLGTGEYGIFSYALGLAGFFTIFADIGITSILTRDVAKSPEKDKEYFATSFWIKSALLLFTVLLVVFGAPLFSKIEAAKALLPFVALLTIADGIREFANGYFRAKERMEKEAFITTIMNIAITAFGFAILTYSATAFSLTVTYVASASVGTILAIFILRKTFRGITSFFRPELIKSIVRSALPVALIAILASLATNVDMIMLGWWKTAEEIGLYASAQKIVQLLYTIPAIFASSIFPILSRFTGLQNTEKEVAMVEKTNTLIISIALPLTVGGIVLSKSIIEFLYGSAYSMASTTFSILIATILFTFPAALFGNFMLSHDKHKKFAPVAGLSSLANVIGNAILIPPFGIVGAAISTLFVQSLSGILMWRIARKVTPFRLVSLLKKSFAAALIMGLFAFVMNVFHIHVLLIIVLSACIYVAALIFMKDNLIEDIKDIFKAMKGTSAPIGPSLE